MVPNDISRRLLIVDDDRHVREVLSRYLRDEAYYVDCAGTASEALALIGRAKPDLVLLDLRLPDASGIDVFPAIRSRCPCPVIMLTACDAETDKVLGLELGADDYVTKPFSPREVLARVRAVLRRAARAAGDAERVHIGELEIDAGDFEARLRGTVLPLTKTEFRILELLSSQPGRTFSREQILDAINADADVSDRTLDKHITNLRKKLERDPSNPKYVLTVYGVGYKMAKDVQPSPAAVQ